LVCRRRRPVVCVGSQEAQAVHSLPEHSARAGVRLDDLHHTPEALGNRHPPTPHRTTGRHRLPSSLLCPPALKGHFGTARSVRLSVPWRSCLDCRLQLSHRRPPEMCELRTRPRTDVDPPRFLPPSNCHRRWAYRLAARL